MLFAISQENEELYKGLMETEKALLQLGNLGLDDAGAIDLISGILAAAATELSKSISDMRDQLALSDKLAKSAEGNYEDTLKEMQGEYESSGQKGLEKIWNTLDNDAKEFYIRHYSDIVKLISGEFGDVSETAFEDAIEKADRLKIILLKDFLVDEASGYRGEKSARDAADSGHQDQFKKLYEGLANGRRVEWMMAGFGEEISTDM